MSEAAVLEALRRGLITPEQAKTRLKPQERQVGAGEAAVRSFAQGITLGGVDELASGIGAVGDTLRGQPIGEAYNRRLEANRAQDAMIAKQQPTIDTAGKIAGGVAGAIGAASAAPASAILNPATAGQLARSGAAYGATQGFLSGEGTEGRILGAGVDAALGAGLGYASGRVLDKVLPSGAPSVEQLKENYVAARNGLREVPIDRQAMRQAMQPVVDDLAYVRNSADPSVLGAIEDLSRAPNAYAVDLVRSNIPSKSPQGAQLRKTVDEFLEGQNVDPAFRDQYRRAMLATKVQDAIARFDTSEAQARTALQNIAKNTKGIKPEEREAILKAAKAPLKIGNIPAAILSLTGGGPAASAATYAGARAVDSVVSDAGSAAMQNALNTVLTGQRMPSYAQRLKAIAPDPKAKPQR